MAEKSKIYEMKYKHQIGAVGQEFEIIILHLGWMLAYGYIAPHRTGTPENQVNSITWPWNTTL